MKTIKVYERTITERTGFRDRRYAFKPKNEFVIYYNEKDLINKVNEPLRVKYHLSLKTRSEKKLQAFLDKIGNRSEYAKAIRLAIQERTAIK